MSKKQQKFILETIKALLEVQLEGVTQLLNEEHDRVKLRSNSGRRNQSLADLSIKILTVHGGPLHVNDIVNQLNKQYGRHTDRDSISSTLSKKARQGLLVQQTAPATFELLPK